MHLNVACASQTMFIIQKSERFANKQTQKHCPTAPDTDTLNMLIITSYAKQSAEDEGRNSAGLDEGLN